MTEIPTPAEVQAAREARREKEELSEKTRLRVRRAMENGLDRCGVARGSISLDDFRTIIEGVVQEMKGRGWAVGFLISPGAAELDWIPMPVSMQEKLGKEE